MNPFSDLSATFRRSLLLGTLLLGMAGAATVKFATVSPLSGPQAPQGVEIKRGAELALAQRAAFFKARGVEVSLQSFDDQAQPARAAGIAQAIQGDPAMLGIVGAFNSGVSNALAEALQAAPLAMVSATSTNVKLTTHGWGFFSRVVAPDSAQSVGAVQFFQETLKVRAVYVMTDGTTYGNGVGEAVRALLGDAGVKVAGYRSAITPAERDGVISDIRRSGADAIFMGAADVNGAELLVSLRGAGVNLPVVGGDGLYSDTFLQKAGKSAAGVYFSSTYAPVAALSTATAFLRQYRARYKEEPNGRAAMAFDAMNALLDALTSSLNRGTPTRVDMIAAARRVNRPSCSVAAVNCFNLTGPLSFSATGERQRGRVYLMRVTPDLKFELVESRSVEAAPVRP